VRFSDFRVECASLQEISRVVDWAAEEGWNPGASDSQAFFAADPGAFLIGHLDGEPVTSISAVRYGSDFGTIGFHLARPAVRGRGYGLRTWSAAIDRLAGRTIALDAVVEQQADYRESGFRAAWHNIRYEGVPEPETTPADAGLTDARAIPFDQLAAYDRRFFPAPRDAFWASWISLPDHKTLACVREGQLRGLAGLRTAHSGSRIGPLYAASAEVARSLLVGLASKVPGEPVTIDVPGRNESALDLVESLGLKPSFETARMYTGPAPALDMTALYAVTSLELG
jgi:hypothetical protein